jgi:DNA-binding NtrC family response regulator
VTNEAAMEEHGILVADKDTAFLKEVTDYFGDAGYEVETTDSAVHVICNILKKKTPVVILGSDFDKKVDLLNLVQLLKKCNRHLAVIMVSDEESLPIVRRIRQEGIFYHALRPVSPADTDEIKQAVKCALNAAQ